MIVELPELVGRTIVAASKWEDNDSISIVLDNGGIIQVTATPIDAENAVIHYELEFAPEEE